jgi:hypothetical protein
MLFQKILIPVLIASLFSFNHYVEADVSPNPGKLYLVKNGANPLPIILVQDAPPYLVLATGELADYIQKISGAKPEILRVLPNPVPSSAIWVGYQPKLKELFPGADFDFKNPEEILITANDKNIAITGRDVWKPETLKVTINRHELDGKQMEYGTINAVYTFIQDYLNVRWFWPGDLGEDIIKNPTISLAPFTYRYHPQILSRGCSFKYSSLHPMGAGFGHSKDWTLHQRLQLDSLPFDGGHGFGDWYGRFSKTHPEYFALQPDGTREPCPGTTRTEKMCHSEPSVLAQWLVEVQEQIKAYPDQYVFNASPNDSWASGHCVCERCRAWDNLNGELREFHWKGKKEEQPALSDRDVTFANICATELKKRYPDKNYYVYMLSYGHSRPAPIGVKPADNVIIGAVANFLMDKDDVESGSINAKTKSIDQFIGWGKVTKNLFWRPNTGNIYGWTYGMPFVPLDDAIGDWKILSDNNCKGIYIDMVWEHWATQGPLYYVIGLLTWNPKLDGQSVFEDYCQRGFGPASGDIKAYWRLMEKTILNYRDFKKKSKLEKEVHDFSVCYDKNLFDQAYKLLDQAAAKTASAGGKYSQRVAFVRDGLDFTKIVVDTSNLMNKYLENGQKDEATKAAVLENWKKIEALCNSNPVGLNWTALRPSTRSVGLHPDTATKGQAQALKNKKLAEKAALDAKKPNEKTGTIKPKEPAKGKTANVPAPGNKVKKEEKAVEDGLE